MIDEESPATNTLSVGVPDFLFTAGEPSIPGFPVSTGPAPTEWVIPLFELLGAQITPRISGIASIGGSTPGTAELRLVVGSSGVGTIDGSIEIAVSFPALPVTDQTFAQVGVPFAKPAPSPNPTLIQLVGVRLTGTSGEPFTVRGVTIQFFSQ